MTDSQVRKQNLEPSDSNRMFERSDFDDSTALALELNNFSPNDISRIVQNGLKT